MVIGSLYETLESDAVLYDASVPTMLTAGYIWPSFVPKWTEILVKSFAFDVYPFPIRDFLIKGRFGGFHHKFHATACFWFGWPC